MSEFDKLVGDAEQEAKDHPQQVHEGEQDAEHAVENKIGDGSGQSQGNGQSPSAGQSQDDAHNQTAASDQSQSQDQPDHNQ